MDDAVKEPAVKPEAEMGGRVQELEFQVASILNHLEEAVEKFDSKKTISAIEQSKVVPSTPKSPPDIISIIQDAIVNLNLSKEDEEPNLAILPALKDVERLALLSHTIRHYVLCLDVAHSDYLINWMNKETSSWITQLFRFEDSGVFYDHNYLDGCLKLFRLLLHRKYRTYSQDGFEAFVGNEPVIYYNSPAMFAVAQYLCTYTGLPLHFIQEVPTFTSKKNEELEVFKRILAEDFNKHRVPLLFLASAETQISPSHCDLNSLTSICAAHQIWLHLIGSFVAIFPLLRKKPVEQNTELANSVTITLGSWLNVPALPAATLYKISAEDEGYVQNIDVSSRTGISLPLWTSIQCLGQEKIIDDIVQKFNSCQNLYDKLEKYTGIKIISEPSVVKNADVSVADLIAKLKTPNDVFDLLISSVIFKFVPANNDLWPSSYCDKLNSWLSQVLHRELPVVPINIAEMKYYGTVLCYSPFSNTPLISEADWGAIHACLDQQLDILRSTVAQKETLYKLIQKSTCLKMVELSDWAGLGGVRYVPEAWIREKGEESNKEELNRLNLQIVQQLRNTDSAFSIGESSDGYACIRFGMVGWDSDVADLIGLVETVGFQEEDSWNYIDSMAEVLKKGIETAMQDLQKESEEKLWQEGILRHVPVFGNIVNWWSPISKENGGVKGRSLDLTAGVIESTENIYRYHMQGPVKRQDGNVTSQTNSVPPPSPISKPVVDEVPKQG